MSLSYWPLAGSLIGVTYTRDTQCPLLRIASPSLAMPRAAEVERPFKIFPSGSSQHM